MTAREAGARRHPERAEARKEKPFRDPALPFAEKTRYGRASGPVEKTPHMRMLLAILLLAAAPAAAADVNDYPTAARADYVFGCMKANGDTRLALEHCACSIDVIASIVRYDDYVEAETVASVGQQAGQIGRAVQNTGALQDLLTNLRRAQAEAQVRCF